MAVTAPETAVRERLRALIQAEFAPEALEVRSDKLNESLGQTSPLGGVYPASATEDERDGLVLGTVVQVQLFRQWANNLDPEETVDPAGIEEWAERLRRAVRRSIDEAGYDAHLWYFVVQKIEYPPDPSGNISRLLATVVAYAQNSALVETTG